jgi:hypothetical protein
MIRANHETKNEKRLAGGQSNQPEKKIQRLKNISEPSQRQPEAFTL